MKIPRNVAIAAGLAALAAAPFAIGTSPAWAGGPATTAASASAATTTQEPTGQDELTQLRANQQLLQRRLDQLEQIAQVGVAHPHLPPGTASLAGSFPRSFLIPGTDTSIEIGGRVVFDMTEWFHGGNPNIANSSNSSGYGNATISGIPLAGHGATSKNNWVFYQNVQNSRLFVETRTPTALGEAQTHIEFDFADCTAGGGAGANDCSNLTTFVNPLIPRLRLAYATLGGFMFGQNWGIGTDLAAAPESFDSTGIVGMWGTGRVPEASYTWKVPTIAGEASLEVGLVMPESTMGTPSGEIANDTAAVGAITATSTKSGDGCTNCNATLASDPLKNSWPAPAFALTFHQPWGHIQLHGAFHEIYIDDGAGLNRSYLVGGGGASGSFRLWGKDNFGWSVHGGAGDFQFSGDGSPGAYFPSLFTNYGSASAGCYGAAVACVPAAPTSPASVRFSVPTNVGLDGNVQHWWTPTVRSTLNLGYEHENVDTALVGATDTYNSTEVLGLANLIWSPVPFVDTGVEFFYGYRRTAASHSGDAYGLDYSFVMKF
jgi:hypothetical protein